MIDRDKVKIMNEILEPIEENISPEDIFGEAELEAWAVDHGWVEDESK